MFCACSSIDMVSRSCLCVLEFGCGDSTVKLYNILKNRLPGVKIFYDCYESDPSFLVVNPSIICTLYHKESIDDVALASRKYDLVLIDGPNGVDRMKWYSKITNVIHEGTIILIDDWNHYHEFEESLVQQVGSIWDYDIISLADHEFPIKSYKIIKIINKK